MRMVIAGMMGWVAAIAVAGPCAAQCDPRPLRELNLITSGRGSAPVGLGSFAGRVVFAAETWDQGREVWATDGTPSGTVWLAEMAPGAALMTIRPVAVTSRGVFFQVYGAGGDRSELWVTDGTSAETRRLVASSDATSTVNIEIGADRGDGGIAFILTRRPTGGGGTTTVELWTTDVSAAGTTMLRSFDCCTFVPETDWLVRVGPRLYFASGDSATGKEVWSTDGLPGGTTVMETTFGPDPLGLSPLRLTVSGGKLFFSGIHDSAFEPHVFVPGASPGTGTLTQLGNLNPGPQMGSSPSPLAALGSGVVFWADDGVHGREPWFSDGTPGGTVSMGDLAPGSEWLNPGSSGDGVAKVGGRLVWASYRSDVGYELFATDGTPGGSGLVRELYPAAVGGPMAVTGINGLAAAVVGHDAQIFITDGTSAGTYPLLNLVPPPASGIWRSVGVLGGKLYVATDDWLYRTDGTVGGTEAVALLAQPNTWSGVSVLGEMSPGGKVILAAADARWGQEPWVADPATHTASMIADLNAADGSTTTIGFAQAGRRAAILSRLTPGSTAMELWSIHQDPAAKERLLVFGTGPTPTGMERRSVRLSDGANVLLAGSTISGSALVRSDGTATGTWTLGSLVVQQSASVAGTTSRFAAAGSRVVYSSYTSDIGTELYVSNGTPNSGMLLRDIAPGFGTSSNPGALTTLGDKVFFYAAEPSSGYEPWISDGTAAGTMRLKDIRPGASSSSISNGAGDYPAPAVMGGRVYFGAFDGSAYRVWSTDGTPAGTVPLVVPGLTLSGTPRRLVATENLVFFDGNAGGIGTEVYVTDGTAAGTHLLRDVSTTGGNIEMREMVAARGRVYFVPPSATAGVELWTSDGTTAGTVLTRDIVPGSGGPTPQNLTPVGGVVYFTLGATMAQGSELWRSDGTAAGTCMVADLHPFGSSAPTNLSVIGSRLYFIATTPQHGTEAYVIDTCPGDFDASGRVTVLDIFDYIGAWFAGLPDADVDGAPGLSAQDVLTFVSMWFDACP